MVKILNKKLRIKDAFKEDAGRGIIRIDSNVLNELNLKVGNVIQITHPVQKKKLL